MAEEGLVKLRKVPKSTEFEMYFVFGFVDGTQFVLLGLALIPYIGFIPTFMNKMLSLVGILLFIIWSKIYGIGFLKRAGGKLFRRLAILALEMFLSFSPSFILLVFFTIRTAHLEINLAEHGYLTEEDRGRITELIEGDIDRTEFLLYARERGTEIAQRELRKRIPSKIYNQTATALKQVAPPAQGSSGNTYPVTVS